MAGRKEVFISWFELNCIETAKTNATALVISHCKCLIFCKAPSFDIGVNILQNGVCPMPEMCLTGFRMLARLKIENALLNV